MNYDPTGNDEDYLRALAATEPPPDEDTPQPGDAPGTPDPADLDNLWNLDPDPGFWDSTPQLKWIHAKARARAIGPYVLLGTYIARYAADNPPSRTLPPIIGTEANTNVAIASVGRSGGGKGIAASASRDTHTWLHISAEVLSGEAIADLYGHHTSNGTARTGEHALITFDESDTAQASGNRQGSTLISRLRTLLSPSAQLGGKARTAGKGTIIAPGTYSAGVLFDVQPQRAAWILDDWQGGLPQRILWLPTNDPTRNPDIDYPDPGPSPLHTKYLCDGECLTRGTDPDQWHRPPEPIQVCDTARTELLHARNNMLRSPIASDNNEDLSGHLLITQERVAAHLAAMHGKHDISEQMWQLAGEVMKVSAKTVDLVRDSITRQKARENEAAAKSQGRRTAIAEDVAHAHGVARVAKNLVDKTPNGGIARSDLRSEIAQRDRKPLFADALALCLERGTLRVEDHNGGQRIYPC